ncbi:MAG: hypothetical protein FIA95_12480, partial [Gemmatimonadetes bacterium]|nr:hypothetical protein [Gemmatimonadota bacterium]
MTTRSVIPVLAVMAAVVWAACGPQGAAVATPAEAGEATAPGSLANLAQSTAQAPQTATTQSAQVDASRRTAIVQAASLVAPAVVNVSVISREEARPESLWESFFMPPGQQRRAMGFGSGVIVRADGIILTNDHVVRNSEQIKVTLPDGRDFEAELVGTDQVADVAVLRVRGSALPVAPVGTAEGLLIGEWAVAIGNPFANYFADAEPTVTAGVVSAVGRNIVPSAEDEGFY